MSYNGLGDDRLLKFGLKTHLKDCNKDSLIDADRESQQSGEYHIDKNLLMNHSNDTDRNSKLSH
jgi:hypothetical protein